MEGNIENGYLLDTNIVSLLFRGRNGDSDPRCTMVLNKAHEANNSSLFICSATVGEIEYGLQLSSKPSPDLHSNIRRSIESFPVIYPIDRHVAKEYYAELRARLFKKFAPKDIRGRIKGKMCEEMEDPTTGKTLGIQENDLWIVSVALTHNLVLVTNDKMAAIREIVNDELVFEDWAN